MIQMHFKNILFVTLLIVLTFTSSCSNKKISTKKIEETPNYEEELTNNKIEEAPKAISTDNIIIKRGLAAKMLALTYLNITEIYMTDREISFTDTKNTDWYDKYINVVKILNIMLGGENSFRPNDPLTIKEAQNLIDKIDKNNTHKIKLTEENQNKPISYALWLDLYYNTLKNISSDIKTEFNIIEKNIIVLATKDNYDILPEFGLITDNGPLNHDGINMTPFIDKEIKILLKDNEIIGVLSVLDEKPTIKNAYITKNTNDSITIFTGGVEKTYQSSNINQDLKNKICDIQIDNQKVINLKIYDESISSTIKLVNKDTIELVNIGIKKFTENFKIYSVIDGNIKWKSLSNLTVGTDIAYYVLNDGNIGAAIITKTPSPFNIRVAIGTTGFKSLFHENVLLTSNEDFIVSIGEETKEFKPNEIFAILKEDNLYNQNRISVKTKSENGKIAINSIKRNEITPFYRGTIEISKNDSGYIIVNELPLDEYLYSVVPSEMPTNYGLEASKVQAITARSYAYVQFYANKFHEYGANVDDSVICQVYNNNPENDISIKAVNDTKDLYITYNDEVISTNFFSTSAGYTANSGDVWANVSLNQFPSETKPYLQASKQYSGIDFGDLSIEENADKFFKNTEIDSFDKEFAWFRWNFSMTNEELTASINANLADRYNSNPSLIKTLQSDGYYRSKPISNIGDLKNLEIMKRGEAGNVMQLKIVGTNASIMVFTEYNIRCLLRPKQYINNSSEIVLNRIDETKSSNYFILPSSFFTFDKIIENEKITKINFFGGGNGHGVGMSQNGVKHLIDNGFTYNEVIKHYFSGVEIKEK